MNWTAEKLITFERSIAEEWERGELPFLLHLCGGNEAQLLKIFSEVNSGDWVISTHRNHYHYLLAGGTPEQLRREIRQGRSMFIFDPAINFISTSIVCGGPAIAAGLAWSLRGSGKTVWCFLGDGAEDNGHFYEAVLFVHGHNLPCRFIIEDNDRSVESTKQERRGERDGMAWLWPGSVQRYKYTPTYPHAGSGCKHHIVFKPKA